MWPETKDKLAERMTSVNAVAQKYERTLDYGLRAHVIVRDTEAEARDYAEHLVAELDDEYGKLIREINSDMWNVTCGQELAAPVRDAAPPLSAQQIK